EVLGEAAAEAIQAGDGDVGDLALGSCVEQLRERWTWMAVVAEGVGCAQPALAEVRAAVGFLPVRLLLIPGCAAEVDDGLGHDAPPAITGTGAKTCACSSLSCRRAARRSACSWMRTRASRIRLTGPIQSIFNADHSVMSTKMLSQPGPPSRTMTASRLAR